jgi:hypothetical protein
MNSYYKKIYKEAISQIISFYEKEISEWGDVGEIRWRMNPEVCDLDLCVKKDFDRWANSVTTSVSLITLSVEGQNKELFLFEIFNAIHTFAVEDKLQKKKKMEELAASMDISQWENKDNKDKITKNTDDWKI